MKYIVKNNLLIILLISFTLRLAAIIFFRDSQVDNEWGIILMNLEMNGILSVHTIQNVPVPNIFMPPLYPLFLYSIKIFFVNADTFLWAIFLIQLFLGIFTVYLTHKILLNFFSRRLSILGTLVFAIFPLNIYAVSQISSVTLQVFLFNIFLYSYFKSPPRAKIRFSLVSIFVFLATSICDLA